MLPKELVPVLLAPNKVVPVLAGLAPNRPPLVVLPKPVPVVAPKVLAAGLPKALVALFPKSPPELALLFVLAPKPPNVELPNVFELPNITAKIVIYQRQEKRHCQM